MGYKEERKREIARARSAGIEPATPIKEHSYKEMRDRINAINSSYTLEGVQINPELRQQALDEASKEEGAEEGAEDTNPLPEPPSADTRKFFNTPRKTVKAESDK